MCESEDIAGETSLVGEIVVSECLVSLEVVSVIGLEVNFVEFISTILIQTLELAEGSAETNTEAGRCPFGEVKVDCREGELLYEAVDPAVILSEKIWVPRPPMSSQLWRKPLVNTEFFWIVVVVTIFPSGVSVSSTIVTVLSSSVRLTSCANDAAGTRRQAVAIRNTSFFIFIRL